MRKISQNYRAFFVASVVCLLIATIFGMLLQPEKPTLAGDGAFLEEPTSYRAGGGQCEPSKIGSLPIRLRERRAEVCAEAEQQHRETANSIIEARRAANAADASVIIAYQQTKIAAWGFSAGIITLLAAVAAAMFAERAAYHTKRSADAAEAAATETSTALKFAERNAKAAEEAVTHAREVSENDLRPWISFDVKDVFKISTDQQNIYFWFEITIKNLGSFPAVVGQPLVYGYPVGMRSMFARFEEPEEFNNKRMLVLITHPEIGQILAPSEEGSVNTHARLSRSDWASTFSNWGKPHDCGLQIWGEIRIFYRWRGKNAFVDRAFQIVCKDSDFGFPGDPDVIQNGTAVFKILSHGRLG